MVGEYISMVDTDKECVTYTYNVSDAHVGTTCKQQCGSHTCACITHESAFVKHEPETPNKKGDM